MARVLCVLYDDPAGGHPPAYARNTVPKIELYPDGQVLPSPAMIDFKPGELLGSLSGGLGLRTFLAARGHSLVVMSDGGGPNSVLDRELPQADVVISQACWPARLTAERIARAHKLKLVVTAGVGCDHIDLDTAARCGVTVAEVTYSDSVSAAEYTVMLILSLVHNTTLSAPPGTKGGVTLADYARRAYDLEKMQVGTVGAGHVGFEVLRRLRPFDVRLHYTDPQRLPLAIESELALTYHPSTAEMVPSCDVVAINAPLYPRTARLFDRQMIGRMKRGAYLVNTSRADICDLEAVARATETGHLAGYAADADCHPSLPGTQAHLAGASLSAQARYAAGAREILECWFDDVPIPADYLILDHGTPTAAGARSYGLRRGPPGAGRSRRPTPP